jgi:6-phosphogluconolactonase
MRAATPDTATRSTASAGSRRRYDHRVTTRPRITVAESASALAEAAAGMIAEVAREAIAARGRFLVALAGGATPRETYARLAAPPLRESMPWDRTWVFFGDERAVPADHRESNYRMAHEALLSAVPLPRDQVFRMRADAEDPEAAAANYAAAMLRVFRTAVGELPRFDLVLLGLGVDGHTASLFPNSPALREPTRWVVSVHATAAAIPRRLTLTLPVLNAARHVAFLSAGGEKAKVVRATLQNGAGLPAAMVQPRHGSVEWLLDRAAAALLDVAGDT